MFVLAKAAVSERKRMPMTPIAQIDMKAPKAVAYKDNTQTYTG
jgi:hypothetical protein